MKCAIVLVSLVAVCSSLEFEKRITPDGTLEINWPGGHSTYWNSILAEKIAASKYPVQFGQDRTSPERKDYQYPQEKTSERNSYGANLESYQSPSEEFETHARLGNDLENSEKLPYSSQVKKTLNEQNEKLVSNKLHYGNQYSSNQDINARFWTPLTHKYAYQLNQDFPYAHDYSYQQYQKVRQIAQNSNAYPHQEYKSTPYTSEYPYPQNKASYDTEMNRGWFQPQEYYGNDEYHYGYPYEHDNYY